MTGLVPAPVVPVLPVRLVPGHGPAPGLAPPAPEHAPEHPVQPVPVPVPVPAGPAPADVVVRYARAAPDQSDAVPEEGWMLQRQQGVLLGALMQALRKVPWRGSLEA